MLALGKRQFCGVEVGEHVTAGDARVVLQIPTRLTLRGSERSERVESTIVQKAVRCRRAQRIQVHGSGTNPV